MHKRPGARALALLGLSLTLAACSGGTTSTGSTGGGTSSPAPGTTEPSAAGGASGGTTGGGGANGYEGSLASSGIYSANWTVMSGGDIEVFNSVANPSMTSDKGTFGNIKVMPDGSVEFGSAATELNANSSYDGSGAKVTLDQTGQFVCAFTIDSDLKGNHDGAVLHMSGGLTAHWHPEGLGGLNCP